MSRSPDVPRPSARGAVRSERARAAVLEAAWGLFTETDLRGLTVEAIAARSGVAKTTVYRWWPSKTAVVLDALHEHLDATISFAGTGSVRDVLRGQVGAVLEAFTTRAGRAYLALVAESQHDADLAEQLTRRYLAQRRAAAIEVVERGVASGELRADTDAGAVVDLVYGAVYYRFLVSHDPPPPSWVETIVALALDGAATCGHPHHRQER